VASALCALYGNADDRYNDEYQGAPKKDQPDYVEDDEWENGNKSAAEEAIERVKEIVGKGLDDSDEQRWLVHFSNINFYTPIFGLLSADWLQNLVRMFIT